MKATAPTNAVLCNLYNYESSKEICHENKIWIGHKKCPLLCRKMVKISNFIAWEQKTQSICVTLRNCIWDNVFVNGWVCSIKIFTWWQRYIKFPYMEGPFVIWCSYASVINRCYFCIFVYVILNEKVQRKTGC